MFLRRLFLLLPLMIAPWALAQFGFAGRTGNLQVRITFSDGRHCNIHAHVILMAQSSTSRVAESYTNDDCMTEFNNLQIGNYHIVVSGEGIEDSDSGVFEVDERKISQFVYVTVRSQVQAGTAEQGVGGPTVAVLDMNIPENARKQYEKAAEPISKGQWKKAKEFILKALAIYPKFAAAYNDLGVVYGRLGDRLQERESLQRAVGLNDHFAAAYVNLGKMDIVDRNFPDAEQYLDKAASSDPKNPATLMLLANVELLNQHFDDAIANCRKVHTMPHSGQTLVHYIAARALIHENRLIEAVTELRTFLLEEPTGQRADAARAELSKLQAVNN